MDYYRCNSLESTLSVLKQFSGRSKIIAGGTDLIPRLRKRDYKPELLIDIGSLPLLNIQQEGHTIRIGARTTFSEVISSPLLASHFPALFEASTHVASPPVRNRATVAGNLVNASPAADAALPLLVYGAELTLLEQSGSRCVPLSDFFIGPGKSLIQPWELLADIKMPLPPKNVGSAFLKLGRRSAMAISIVSAAAAVALDSQGKVCHVHIALGSVAPTPVRAYEAENILLGFVPTSSLIGKSASAVLSAVHPISDVRAGAEYRRSMATVLTARVLRHAINQAAGGRMI